MDAPSPEPQPAASAPAPAGFLEDAAAAGGKALAGSNSSSFNHDGGGNISAAVQTNFDKLEFDSTAACVGLGGSAWTCFKKELPDSQIATRWAEDEESPRAFGEEKGIREKERALKTMSRFFDLVCFFSHLLPHLFFPTNEPRSLWLWTAVGLACMLLFCALLHLIPTYRTRLFLPNLVS